jgi:phosphatidylserine/phosphatidylglycerophosphate/cardiolipin synthase-like enzyme
LGFSNDSARELGALLTGSEAREIADHLADDDTLTASLRVVSPGRRAEVRSLLSCIDRAAMIAVLRAIEGARSAPTTVDPLWTMPGHLAQHGRLTQSVTYLVDSARHSVVCSTFNFQRSSGLWKALQRAAERPEIAMKVYMDMEAADAGPRRPGSPTTDEVAAHLAPALILRTKRFEGRQVRSHSKFLSIDHRFLLITSANFSWSAEYGNLELGVLIDNANLAEAIENEMRQVEDFVFEQVRT